MKNTIMNETRVNDIYLQVAFNPAAFARKKEMNQRKMTRISDTLPALSQPHMKRKALSKHLLIIQVTRLRSVLEKR